MYEAGYYLSKIKSKIKRNDKKVINNFFRRHGVKIGGMQHLLQYLDTGVFSY